MFDYHVHSEFSVDCNVPMRASCEAAIAAGVTEIAFTDHMDSQPTDEGYGYYRIDEYLASLEAVRAEFKDRLVVLKGVEVDYHQDTLKVVDAWMNANASRYDFIIGSVHYGDNAEIIFQKYFEGKTNESVFNGYFDQLEQAIATGWFSTMGHLDLPKRYLPKTHRNYEPGQFRDRFEKLFELLKKHDVGFEINTSGLRQTPKTSMPGPAVVRWWAEAGGTFVTTGTDSHATQAIGTGLLKTLDMLRLCGIEHVASFRERKRTLVPISSLQPAG